MATSNRIIEPLTFILESDGKAHARLSIEPDELKQVIISINGLTQDFYYNMVRDGQAVVADATMISDANIVSADYWTVGEESALLEAIDLKLDAALSTAVSASVPTLNTTTTRSIVMTDIVARAKVQLSGRKQIQGMNKISGRVLEGTDHLQQSISDILLTPIGSRVMRRSYGSRLLELISQPYVKATVLQVYAAIADALRQWEPRFVLKRIQAKWRDINQQSVDREAGLLNIEMTGDYLGRNVSVSVAI